MSFFRRIHRASLRAAALLALCAGSSTFAQIVEPEPRRLGLGDTFIWAGAAQMRECLDNKSCQVSLEDYFTDKPYVAFIVKDTVFERFNTSDREIYRLGAGHLLLELHDNPKRALLSRRYGVIGLDDSSHKLPEYAANIKKGAREVRFFVTSDVLTGHSTRLVDVRNKIPKPHMNYKWAPAQSPMTTTAAK